MKSRFDAALRSISALVPAGLAALGASSTALAAHDVGVVRTVGAGGAGVFRSLDLVVAAPAMMLPIGTRALRAGLAGAVVTGICGAVAFDLARAVVAEVVPLALGWRRKTVSSVSPRLVAAVATVAVLTALCSPVWQVEAAAPGGSTVGALLVLVALWMGKERSRTGESKRSGLPATGLLLGLAASYEPLVFVAALGALAPSLAYERERKTLLHAGCMFLVGLLPTGIAVAVALRAPEIAVDRVAWLERAAVPVAPAAFAWGEIGGLLLGVSAIGAGLTVTFVRVRAMPLLAVALVGTFALVLKVPAGPSSYAAVVLAGMAAAYVLGAVALGVVVLAIARARVPFAEASAALVVVLELVLPVRSIDETLGRREGHALEAAAIWSDVAWSSAPPAAVLLVPDRGTMQRIASTRAAGAMRADLVVVPAYDVQGRAGQRALLAEPKLAPLYRDVALGLAPEELSLAQLGAQRAVLATFDPRWDRALSRHLLPLGLLARFEPEPRGASERQKAFDAFAPSKDRLVRISVAKKDAELAAATSRLLRARAVAMAATGEREMLARALDELRAFAPDDPVGAALVRRSLTTKGAIDVRDLAPAN